MRLAERGWVVSAEDGRWPPIYALFACLVRTPETQDLPWDKRPSVGRFVGKLSLSLTVTPLRCRPLDWNWRRLLTLATSCEAP